MQFTSVLKNFHQEESGQDLVEYALVLVAVALAAVTGSQSLASTISSAVAAINTKISTAIAAVS
jgi:pilus assembly protein Flp/PilA